MAGERLGAKLGDALARALQLARRHELLESAAGVDEADERDVARGGLPAVRQCAGEALPEVPIGIVVDGVGACRAEEGTPVPFDAENAARRQLA